MQFFLFRGIRNRIGAQKSDRIKIRKIGITKREKITITKDVYRMMYILLQHGK